MTFHFDLCKKNETFIIKEEVEMNITSITLLITNL